MAIFHKTLLFRQPLQKMAAVISVTPSIFKYLVLNKSEEECPISSCNTCKFLKCLAK